MKQFIGILLLFTCANVITFAQVNFVKNPSFEDTVRCVDEINQIGRAKYWTCAVDTIGEPYYAPEYYTAICEVFSLRLGVPANTAFYQYPHTGNAMVGAHLYYDRTSPSPGGLFDTWRDYFQGRLHKPLVNGKTYCVSFWVNLAEASGYAQDKIGAYLDNGAINDRDTPGNQILDVVPQVYTKTIQKDTQNWTRIEGTFVATGNETHITVGNFFPNADVAVVSNTWGPYRQYTYYLFDDVAVIPIDLKPDAGRDSHAEPGEPVQIGRVGDTTAQGLDCKWYYKGALIDSGAVISVKGAAIVGKVDTYVVVQTICDLSKTDTVTVRTVPLGMKEWNDSKPFSVFPNPSDGSFSIKASGPSGAIQYRVYDFLGRMIVKQKAVFLGDTADIKVGLEEGVYILELISENGNSLRQQITIK